MPKKYIPKQFSPIIYPAWYELFRTLTDKQRTEVLYGITLYPKYEPKDCPVWLFIKSQIKIQYDNFIEKCNKNKEIVKTYWENEGITKENERSPKRTKDNLLSISIPESESIPESKKESKEKNKKPLLEEVVAYCKERNKGVDPNKWYDYYTANGFKVGKSPMKDWKACVRYWEKQKNTQPTETYGRNMEIIKQMELNGEI